MPSESLWVCHMCRDGPKLFEHQPQCVSCGHIACAYCHGFRKSSSDGNTPTESLDRPDSIALRGIVPRSRPSTTLSRSEGHPRVPAVELARARKGRAASLFQRNASNFALQSVQESISEPTQERKERDDIPSASPTPLRAASDPEDTLNAISEPGLRDESLEFAVLWEETVIPVLLRRIPSIVNVTFTIDVVRNPKQAEDSGSQISSTRSIIHRIVLFTTPSVLDRKRQEIVGEIINVSLPEQYASFTKCDFVVGKVRRCCEAYCGKSESDLDISGRPPKRMFYQPRPAMGASIGLYKSPCTGTLGGYVLLNGEHYLGLACDHIFEDVDELGKSRPSYEGIGDQVVQPSYMDSPAESRDFGQLVFSSGYRKRPPVKPNTKVERDQDFVRVDWALLSIEEQRLGRNVMVMDDGDLRPVEIGADPSDHRIRTRSQQTVGCGGTDSVKPGQIVHSVGRTSGYQKSRIVEARTVYFEKESGTTTLEWGLYQDTQSHLEWTLRGPGQPGDSGAWVIDRVNNTYLGMIFARGPSWGEGERIAYFSTFDNMAADIREVMEYHINDFRLRTIEFVKPEIIHVDPEEIAPATASTRVTKRMQYGHKDSPLAVATTPANRSPLDQAADDFPFDQVVDDSPVDQIAQDLVGLGNCDLPGMESDYQARSNIADGLFYELESFDNHDNPLTARVAEREEDISMEDTEIHPVVARQSRAVGGVHMPWKRNHLRAFNLVLPVR